MSNMFNFNKGKYTKSQLTRRREKIISFIILFIVCLFWALPIVYMIGNSFKSDMDLQLNPQSLFPTSLSEFTFQHYDGFFMRDGQIDNMPKWMLNSLWSTAATVILTVLVDAITAYALVFMDFKGKNVLFKFMLIWMAVPGIIGTSASYSYYVQVKTFLTEALASGNATTELTNAVTYFYVYFWLIVPGAGGIFNILLMRNFFASIPMEIIESARSDGATNGQIFRRIVMPLAKSTVMLIVLFSFVGAWNNFQFPQLLLSGRTEWQTMTVALAGFTGGNAWGMKGAAMATCVFSSLPILIIFLITQDKMIDGLANTGVKH